MTARRRRERQPAPSTQLGPGTLTLTGANTYTGATTVTAGTLLINGTQTAATGGISVASGATLGGTGTTGGAVTVADGGHLAPGAGPGTLTTGALTLNPGSLLDSSSTTPSMVGGPTNDLTVVNGATDARRRAQRHRRGVRAAAPTG